MLAQTKWRPLPCLSVLFLLVVVVSPSICRPVHPVVPPSSPRTLLIVEDSAQLQHTHSLFFQQLVDLGHRLTFSTVFHDTAADVRLFSFGDRMFDNVIVMAPHADEFGGGDGLSVDGNYGNEVVTVENLISFVDKGGNLLLVTDVNMTEATRQLALEFGFDFDDDGTYAMDHVTYELELDDGNHTVFTLPPSSIPSSSLHTASQLYPSLFRHPVPSPILYHGVAHSAAHSHLPYLFPLLSGNPVTTLSYFPHRRLSVYPFALGADTQLVTVLQTRTNARVGVAGSLTLFSDAYFSTSLHLIDHFDPDTNYPVPITHAHSGNADFVKQMVAWLFQQSGVIRATRLRHRKKSISNNEDDDDDKNDDASSQNPSSYRIGDDISFSIVLEEWDGVVGREWVPFRENDVQLEFVMLDPYIRTTLLTNGDGLYYTNFTVPDVPGVFKFRIDYARKGYSSLLVEQQVALHPYRHDEFDRFLLVAVPYYISAFSIMAAFFVFGIVFLYQSK